MGSTSHMCQDSDKSIFDFSSHNQNGHEKAVLCKGLSFIIRPKTIEYSEILLPSEILFGDYNIESVKK